MSMDVSIQNEKNQEINNAFRPSERSNFAKEKIINLFF